MLKWFKKLTDRLFGDEIEEEFEAEIKDVETQQVKKTNDRNNEARATFRFPMITDAEIYGWEEEDTGETERAQQPIVKDFKDDFEPTPLYQNERWPQQKQPDIVHRSRPSLNEESVEQRFSVAESEKTKALKTELQTIQKKRRTDRFTPYVVPSPVHGYQMLNRKKELAAEQPLFKEQVEEAQMNAEEVLLVEQQNIVEEAERDHLEGIAVEEVLQESSVEEHSLEVEADMEYLSAADLKGRIEVQEQLNEETMQQIKVAEVACTTEEVAVETEELIVTEEVALETEELIVTEEVAVETEELIVTEEVAVETEELIVTEEVAVETEELIVTEEVALETEEPIVVEEVAVETEEPIIRERVRPFNVLMLKSDQKRLKAIEIANEMQAKVQSIIQDEEPLIVEESPKELVIPAAVKNDAIEVTTPIVPKQEASPIVVAAEAEVPVLVEEQPLAHYALPSIDYLLPPESQIEDTEWLASQSEKLEESLSHFGVQANVIDAVQGPTVTRFELTVGQGTKVSRVRNLADDLKLTLAARDIRIQAPIPGKSSIGIEIPNRNARAVRISEVIGSEAFQSSKSPLEAVLGLGLTGEPETLDLRKMPHGMIAGATGSGKSVCINSILVSLLYKASPVDLKMMLIDPKMVELAPFNGIPHLISPVITDVKAATAALKWAVGEMDRRYELLAHAGVRDIERYNDKVIEHRQFSLKMPYLLIVIDELADLMMMAPADVEVSISRIAQKARACGIHLIIATQRPSVDVITGIIKANIPTRIAFSVSSQVDSRTMIDMNGAERLLGRGDMLYVGNGESTPVRLQGTFVTDDEIERIIEHVQNEASPTYLFGQEELLKSAVEEEEDPLFIEACQFIIKQDSASTSMLQRNFSIGYNRAAKLMDRFEQLNYISPQQGSRARDVYLTEEVLLELKETKL